MAITDNFKKGESLFSTTLVSGISTGTGETITLNSVSGLPTDTEITLTFDRVDSDGEETASSMERITGTISGSTLTSYTRGTDDSTEQAHSADAVVEYIFNSQDWNDLIDGILTEHDQDGGHNDITCDSIDSAGEVACGSVDSAGIGAFDGIVTLAEHLDMADTKAIRDGNNNEWVKFSQTDSAVNEITVTNAETDNAPDISATGEDANIDLSLTAKGTGKIKMDAAYQTPQTYSPDAAGTATLDLSTGNEHRITMPAGNITIAISNETDGQKFIVSILQDGTGSRTVTWFSTIKWPDNTEPTLTTTANKRDVFGFIVTGTDTYDGFIVGQNL